jgi:predicted DNA-binding protein
MKRTKLRILEQFRLPPDVSKWLAEQSAKTGKTKTRLVEEALRSKIALKEAA